MTITYYFDNEEPYNYEIWGLQDFIEEKIPFEEQVKLYLDEVYDKDAEERDLMYQDFEVKSRTEMNDLLWSEGGDWLPEAISNNIEDYIFEQYYDEIKDYFEDEAFEDYSESSIDDIHDEWERDYWRSRV